MIILLIGLLEGDPKIHSFKEIANFSKYRGEILVSILAPIEALPVMEPKLKLHPHWPDFALAL